MWGKMYKYILAWMDDVGIEGVTGISTINGKMGSKRCHQHLYNQLKKILEYNDKWE